MNVFVNNGEVHFYPFLYVHKVNLYIYIDIKGCMVKRFCNHVHFSKISHKKYYVKIKNHENIKNSWTEKKSK